MLEELTGYSSFGTSHLLLNMVRRMSESGYTAVDLRTVLAADVKPHEMVCFDAALALLLSLDLCHVDEADGKLLVSESLCVHPGQRDCLSSLSTSVMHALKPLGVFAVEKLEFDSDLGRFFLPLMKFPLKLAPYRNLLVELGMLERLNNRLYLSDTAQDIIRDSVVPLIDGLTPDELYQKLEENRRAGELAELFVMKYESKRLGSEKAQAIIQVSAISVSAGYDIASFSSRNAIAYDRFIEVKAIGNNGFYFSSNELAVAREKGTKYCIYLVDLNSSNDESYEPTIIVDPASYFNDCKDWRIVPSSYHITPLS